MTSVRQLVTLLYLCFSSTVKASSLRNGHRSLDDSYDISSLRILTLGASSTWGATLPNRYTAYPYLLSPSVRNLAVRASVPDFIGSCTQSYIGEDIYDVIIVEYFPRVKQGLENLATRVRERFPRATIVFLQLWYPRLLGLWEEDRCVFMDDWLQTNGFGIHVGHLDNEHLLNMWKEKEFCWETSASQFWIDEHESIRKKVNGHLLVGPYSPWDLTTNATQLFWEEHKLFHEDLRHLSQSGHTAVAKRLELLIQKIKPLKSDVVGTWGEGDSCQSWFLEAKQLPFQHSDGLRMKEFDEKNHKYALEIAPSGGRFTIQNPFKEPRGLVLTYMAMGPEFAIYPKTEVSLAYRSGDSSEYLRSSEPVVINPMTNDHVHFVHVAVSETVGVVQPGDNDVFLKSLEHTDAPFRVVSVAVTSNDRDDAGK